jgi:transcriptional regulator GlxA family with amidase domain
MHSIVDVVFANTQTLDFVGPFEVFDAANRLAEKPYYRLIVASVDGGSITTSSGLTFVTEKLSSIRSVDTVLVAGGLGTADVFKDKRFANGFRRVANQARRITSVCTGSFVLAELGILDGRRATTHWNWAETMQDRYPDVDVDASAIFVRDEHVWTSAGVSSGIDLALALVGEDLGADVATKVARMLVVYVQRSGGQSQFTSVAVHPVSIDGHEWQDLARWITNNLRADLSVSALATRMHLSDRQFARLFVTKLGSSPGAYVESVRLRSACALLETSGRSLKHIAHQCGFGTVETMHRAFRRRLDTTPTAHREHFTVA